MNSAPFFGFLPWWLRDIGSMIAIVAAVYGLFILGRPKTFFTLGQPANVTGDLVHWTILNVGPTDVRVRKVRSWPSAHYRLTAGISTGHAVRSAYHKLENVLIRPGDAASFRVTQAGIPAPSWIFIMATWQPMNGISFWRPPLFAFASQKTLREMEWADYQARKDSTV